MILSLTGFHKGQSTTRQRLMIMLPLVLGQAGWIILTALNNIIYFCFSHKAIQDIPKDATWKGFRLLIHSSTKRTLALTLCVFIAAVPILAGFVVVGQMLFQDEVCTRL